MLLISKSLLLFSKKDENETSISKLAALLCLTTHVRVVGVTDLNYTCYNFVKWTRILMWLSSFSPVASIISIFLRRKVPPPHIFQGLGAKCCSIWLSIAPGLRLKKNLGFHKWSLPLQPVAWWALTLTSFNWESHLPYRHGDGTFGAEKIRVGCEGQARCSSEMCVCVSACVLLGMYWVCGDGVRVIADRGMICQGS